MFKLKASDVPKVDKQEILPWIEKYRPKSVDEVAYQDEVVNTLKKSLESRNLPHLLFYGPPGTGKTSTILAIGKQLYGPEMFKQRVMELNASDERGINVIRTKVKSFAQLASSSNTSASSQYPCPPYKIIILDECDSMTADAQAALRRTMETYSSTTRFCLICNYVSRIIEPLASRCAKFRFKPLNISVMADRINFICEKEGIKYTNLLGETLADVSEGDLRKAIMLLQSAFSLYGPETDHNSITEIAGKVPGSVLDELVKAATSNSFDYLQKSVNNVIASGYPAAQLISQLSDWLASANKCPLNDLQRSNIAEQLAAADKCLQDGADEFLQLMSVLSFFMKEACSTTSY